jgi:hypothetical protein
MTDVEHFREAALRGLADPTLARQALHFGLEQRRLTKGHRCAHSVIVKDADEVVPMFDCRDDRQSGPEVIYGFRRYREAGHSGDGSGHADVARTE